MELGCKSQFFINEVNNIKKDNIAICEEINRKKDYSNKENLTKIEKIISRDNTDPIVVQTYLKIINKLNNASLLQNIKKYEFFLSKEWINKEFSNTYKKELSSSDLFYRLFNHITTFSTDMNPLEKLNFYRGIGNIGPDLKLKDVIKGFTDYSTNKELSIFIIVQNIKKRILNRIDEMEIKQNNNKDSISIFFDKQMLKEAEIFKKVIDFDKNLSKEEPTQEEREKYNKRRTVLSIQDIDNIDKIIERYKKTIKIKEKLETESFSKYFNNLSLFLLSVEENFNKRFNNLENLNIDDFKLFMDFCFFIEYYHFNEIVYYIDKWNDTFEQTTDYIEILLKEKSIPKFFEFKLKGNSLVLELYIIRKKEKNIYTIENIHKYSINCIISYLKNKYISTTINKKNNIDISNFKVKDFIIGEYDIEKYLKFDFANEIYLKKIWSIFENHLLKIFKSKVINAVFDQICEKIGASKKYELLNDNDLKKIFENTKIFQFRTNILGLTELIFCFDYIFYKCKIDDYTEEYSKLLNLCIYQIVQTHEILGHLNVMIQEFFAENEITSPFSEIIDNSDKPIKNQESGDYIENLLYGESINELNINTILFLLDESKYDLELNEFQNEYKKYKKTTYEISKSQTLKDFLNSLEITSDIKSSNFSTLLIKDSANKSIINNAGFKLNRKRHDHLHPPSPKERDENVEKYIEACYEKFYDQYTSNKH